MIVPSSNAHVAANSELNDKMGIANDNPWI